MFALPLLNLNIVSQRRSEIVRHSDAVHVHYVRVFITFETLSGVAVLRNAILVGRMRVIQCRIKYPLTC